LSPVGAALGIVQNMAAPGMDSKAVLARFEQEQ
jgi:hypothetical protein